MMADLDSFYAYTLAKRPDNLRVYIASHVEQKFADVDKALALKDQQIGKLEQETRALREALAQTIEDWKLERASQEPDDFGQERASKLEDCIDSLEGVLAAASPGVRPAEEPQR